MTIIVGTASCCSLELETRPHDSQGFHVAEPSLASFPGKLVWSRVAGGAVETQTDVLIWDAGIAGGSLALFTTMLVP